MTKANGEVKSIDQMEELVKEWKNTRDLIRKKFTDSLACMTSCTSEFVKERALADRTALKVNSRKAKLQKLMA